MKKEVTFGILGLGRVVDKRLFNVFTKETTNSKVISVFDVDKFKLKKFSNFFKCSVVKNIDEFLAKDFKFVYIATESGNHYSHIKKCFQYNKNVIVEKPPVLKISQLLELNKLAIKKKLKFYSVYQNRLNNAVKFAKNYLNRNKKLIYATLNLSWSRPQSYYNDWHGNWKMDGGVVAQQGIHYIDILIYLFGKPIKCISITSNKVNKLQAEDTHSSIIVFKNNFSCTCNFTTALRPSDFEASIKVYTKENLINLDGLCCNKISSYSYSKIKNKKLDFLCKKNSEFVESGYGKSHSKVIQNIINHEINKKTQTSPLKAIDTLDTLKLLNMMYISATKQKWIYFNEKNLNSKLGN